jgi:hypothetical protein
MPYRKAVADFLAQTRIAVAGVSRQGDIPANAIFRKLRDAGYDVVPVNPSAEEVEGERCFARISDVPGEIDALMIATPPEAAPDLVRECVDRGIQYVWMHRSVGTGSVDDRATQLGREAGLTVIPGGCPMMFIEPVDPFHRCLRWALRVTGSEPEASPSPISPDQR